MSFGEKILTFLTSLISLIGGLISLIKIIYDIKKEKNTQIPKVEQKIEVKNNNGTINQTFNITTNKIQKDKNNNINNKRKYIFIKYQNKKSKKPYSKISNIVNSKFFPVFLFIIFFCLLPITQFTNSFFIITIVSQFFNVCLLFGRQHIFLPDCKSLKSKGFKQTAFLFAPAIVIILYSVINLSPFIIYWNQQLILFMQNNNYIFLKVFDYIRFFWQQDDGLPKGFCLLYLIFILAQFIFFFRILLLELSIIIFQFIKSPPKLFFTLIEDWYITLIINGVVFVSILAIDNKNTILDFLYYFKDNYFGS